MSRPIHFEINADKPQRAAKFYGKVFGWKFKKWNGPMEYWMVDTGKGRGINGGMMKRMHPKATTVNTMTVPSIDNTMDKVKKSGGKIVQDKTVIPGMGYMSYCTDSEGNAFGLMQNDKRAK